MDDVHYSPYRRFSREEWKMFRQGTPLTLTEGDLEQLKGQAESVSMEEVVEVYLPLSRLLNLYIKASQELHRVSGFFLNNPDPKVPYIIGVAGSVAVGKSTTSRVLQALLSRWPDHPNVALLTTDGFLYPNAELQSMGIENRKGFPESYDVLALLHLLQDVKAGRRHLKAPVYSHHYYDIVPDDFVEIDQPDIMIVEGLNILQTGVSKFGKIPPLFVSDFFDMTIYVDADKECIKQWFIDRVLHFSKTSFKEPDSYFHALTKLTEEELLKFADRVWQEINELNLVENILPHKERAQLILRKGLDHQTEEVLLRKL